jgi:hypothetical protein
MDRLLFYCMYGNIYILPNANIPRNPRTTAEASCSSLRVRFISESHAQKFLMTHMCITHRHPSSQVTSRITQYMYEGQNVLGKA